MIRIKYSILAMLLLVPNFSQAVELVIQAGVYVAPPAYVIPTDSFHACAPVSIWNGSGYVNVYAPDCMNAMVRPDVIGNVDLRNHFLLQINTCRVRIPTPAGIVIYYNPACIDRLGFWERIRPLHDQYYSFRRTPMAPRPGIPERSEERYRRPDRHGRIIGMLNDLQQLNHPGEDPSAQQTALTAKFQSGPDVIDQLQDSNSTQPAAI